MLRNRRLRAGTRDERFKLRGVFLVFIGLILSLAAVSTHPTALKVQDSVRSALPRQLTERTGTVSYSRRGLFEVEECAERACAGDDGDFTQCVVDEAFEFVCCESENETEFADLAVCEDKSGRFCAAADLCVAELIPGSAVGAECLQQFELDGGVALYLFLLIYLFLALAIVCDDYFTYALDSLGDLLGLSSDVKGATFAAIGSSAPELFVSLADNVIANPPKSVGVGTIVGSAIFNILVIIGASAVVAGRTFGDLKLNWRPLTRDSFFYIISICGLIGVAATDEEARHYEGAILVILYFGYLTFMMFNQKIFDFVDAKLGTAEDEKKEEIVVDKKDDVEVLDEAEKKAENEAEKKAEEEEDDKKSFGSQGTAIAKGQLAEGEDEPYFSVFHWPWYNPYEEQDEEAAGDAPPVDFVTGAFGGGLRFWGKRLYYIFVLPINICFRFTIPDARYDLLCEDKEGVTDKRAKLYWAEFTMCIVWIAILSHMLVFSASKFGCLVGIDPAVMGLTILAAGTSVPDMITSVLLTKNGEGDAAVANSIGSNVFDILIGLGLPWFLAEFVHGEPSAVATDDLAIAIGFLFGVLIVLLVALTATQFKLNFGIGVSLLVLYGCYVIFELFLREPIGV